MRFGMSMSSTHPLDDPREGAQRMIERARVARDAGLDFLTLGDGHVNPLPYYQGVPMLGRLIAEWDRSRFAGCLFLLPLWHPVIVAEQVATLSSMIDAPFILQAAAGGGEARFAGMGADLRTRGSDLDESIRVIKALLAGEQVDSRRYGLRGAAIALRPRVEVEWWIGASAAAAIERAAREGDAWYAGPNIGPEQVDTGLAAHREACESFGKTPHTVRRRDVIVLHDADRARTLGDAVLSGGYRGMGHEGVAYGGVEEVAEVLATDLALGFDDLAVRVMAVDRSDALETIELCGEVRAILA